MVGLSSPATRRSNVDFPEPAGPSTTVNSRDSMSTVTSRSASTLPNRFETLLRLSRAKQSPVKAAGIQTARTGRFVPLSRTPWLFGGRLALGRVARPKRAGHQPRGGERGERDHCAGPEH